MERGKEKEGEREDRKANSSSVLSGVLREDIVNLLDFIKRLDNGHVQISVLNMDRIEELTLELTYVSAFFHHYHYFLSEGCNDEILSCISNEIHDLVQSLIHLSGEDILVKLMDHDIPHLLENVRSCISSHGYEESSRVTMTEDHLVELLDAILMYLQYLHKYCSELTQYEHLQNVFGILRDFHGLVNGCVEYATIEYVLPHLQLMAQKVVNFCFILLDYCLDESEETDEDVYRFDSKLASLLVEIIPVELEVMHICSKNLKGSKSAEFGRFIKKLLEASPDILREYLIHLQQHMVNATTPSTSARNTNVMMEFLLIILSDVPIDVNNHDKLFVLLARVGALIREVSILVRNLAENSRNEENLKETSCGSLNLQENVELLRKDLKNVFLKAPADSSQLCFPMSDGPQFMTLSVSSDVLHEDIVNLLDFIETLNNEEDQTVLDTDQIEKLKLELTFLSACLHLCYYISDGSNAEMSCISYEVYDLVQSLFHQRGDDMLVKLNNHVVPRLLDNIKSSIISDHHSESNATMTEDQLVELLDALLVNLHYLPKVRAELIFPSITQYKLLQNVFGNLRNFHGLKVNGCIEHKTIEYVLPQFQLMAERVGHFCFVVLYHQLHEVSQVNTMLVHLYLKIIPVSLEVMHICSTILEASKSAEVECFIKKLLEASPDIIREYLIHLQQHMVNAITPSTSARNIHVMIEFLLLFLIDMPKDFIHYEKLFVLLARVGALVREVSILVCNLEENSRNKEIMNETSGASLNLLENIQILKEDLKNVFLKARAETFQLCFPMSDGPLFVTLLLRNLNDWLNSNAYSVVLIKEAIGRVKEDLEHIRSFFGNVEQELHRDLWTRVLDVAYEAQHTINSILARDHGVLQLIFLLPDCVEKIKLVKKEVQEKISKNTSILFVNSPNKPVENKSSIAGKIIVGFEEETKWIIRKLTSGPAEIDVISIIGMPGLGKSTLAYRVYNDKSVVGHFDVRAWCTVDQERNEKKLLQKIFNQVIGLKERVGEADIDDDVADKLRKRLFGKRYLIVLDDLWDTATWDELTRPFPSEFQKGSRVILTSRKKEVALHGKCHSDPLDLRLLRPEESLELLEKRVFGEERFPDDLKDVGEKIAQKCEGLPLVLDLIGGVIARKEKKKALWLEVLHNLKSFIFKHEMEVMKVIQLSYDHLSDHLKPCFLYLASYPKDEDIEISELKDLWGREGLVEPTDLNCVEEVMEVYVDELISSSLVLVRGGRKQRCQIHDLVHDFCSIKARKEKLFDLTSSTVLSSSSSSDPMLRGMTIHYNKHPNIVPFLFNPEKKNPSAKHLLSLKVHVKLEHLYGNVLPYSCHIRHLRLLKMLDLRSVNLADSLLNEIGMLVHLRCLIIEMKPKALPPSFSNLCNLETLKLINRVSNMVLSPSIWSLAKLRHVDIFNCSVFDSDIDKPTKLENLTTLMCLELSCLVDSEDILKRFPNLRTLEFCVDCSAAEQIYFPRLDVLTKLEKVHARFECCGRRHVHQFDFHFPSSLNKLKLSGFDLTSDALSGIGRSLPNLQELRIWNTNIQGGKEWNMEQVTFQNLKFLSLDDMSFSKWQVIADESFPVLEELEIAGCTTIKEIPESFGDVASLKLIRVYDSRKLKDSALKIKEYVTEMTGEDKLDIIY